MGLHALQSDYMLSEYRIERLLGEGGFGLTYLAFDTNIEKQVAIKEYMPSEHAIRKENSQIIPKSETSRKTYNWGLKAFLNEAKILAKFEDPNIVRIYRFFKANGTAYIVMEYCEGGCLVDRVSKNKHMNEVVLQRIVSAIVHGLQLVHNQGILHRDIKPDNIMFRLDGTPVLIDFGAARQAIGEKSRKVTTIITPGYAPLEQYSSKGTIGPWSDIYSLAAVAYLCLTGKKPPDIMNRLHDDTIKALNKKGKSSFLKAIDLGLEIQVEDRPKSLSEWSSLWGYTNTPKAIDFDTISRQLPIIATRIEEPLHKVTVRQPISARTSLRSDERTIVSNQDIVLLKKDSSFSILRVFFSVFIISAIAVGGFFAYELYLKTNKQNLLTNQQELTTPPTNKQNTDLILQVQQKLIQLGFDVKETGLLDNETNQSIKTFENKNHFIVTGSVDNVLLGALNKALANTDFQAWKLAKTTNTIVAYQQFTNTFPHSNFTKQVSDLIEQLRLQETSNNTQAITSPIKDQAELQNLQRLKIITEKKVQLIKDIQIELKRLKFNKIVTDGNLDELTVNSIITYQKLRKFELNGLPTKILLFQLKKQKTWPDNL